MLTSESKNASQYTDFIESVSKAINDLQHEKRGEILSCWNNAIKNKGVEVYGDDENNRPIFVTLQGIIEQTIAEFLSNKKISSAVGVIHTPLPCTPLRIEQNSEIPVELVRADVKNDPIRSRTVTYRAVTLREYLGAGGVLVCAYQRDNDVPGLNTFRKLQEECPNLISVKLKKDMDTGAIYILRNNKGENLMFSFESCQASENQPSGAKWGAYSGNETEKHFEKICEVLHENGVDIKALLGENLHNVRSSFHDVEATQLDSKQLMKQS